MKEINKINIWSQGTSKEANKFNCYSVFDNFKDSATLYYALINEQNETLAQGNLQLDGDNYVSWDSNPSANEWAYSWAASQLNLTIIGDWVDPVAEGAFEGAFEGATEEPVIEQPVEEVVTEEETPTEPEV